MTDNTSEAEHVKDILDGLNKDNLYRENLGKDHFEPPANWEETKRWFNTLDQNIKIANALLSGPYEINYRGRRRGIQSGLPKYLDNWSNLVMYMNGHQRAGQFVDLLEEQKKTNEDLAIRTLDLFLDCMIEDSRVAGENPMGIKEVIFSSSSKEEDWQVLLNELRMPNSIFLTDSEMKKLSKDPIHKKPTNKPARYEVANLWSGAAEIEETKGDFQKSIDYYKKMLNSAPENSK